MAFFEWLRRNSEDYLLEAAQREMAQKYLGRPGPAHKRGGWGWFWRSVFTPVYRLLPWGLRRRVIRLMPGSHRRRWVGRAPPAGTA
jgi:hypothetical protein